MRTVADRAAGWMARATAAAAPVTFWTPASKMSPAIFGALLCPVG